MVLSLSENKGFWRYNSKQAVQVADFTEYLVEHLRMSGIRISFP